MSAPARPGWAACLSVLALVLWAVAGSAVGATEPTVRTPPRASGPALARLAFWVPPEQLAAFAAGFRQRLVPVLRQHGLEPVAEPSRATADSVFSQLLVLEGPAVLAGKRDSLEHDAGWHQALATLTTELGLDPAAGESRYELTIYRCPAGAGTTVAAGGGDRYGPWVTYSRQHGLPGSWVNAVLQDRDGAIWCAPGSGVTRFDGALFTTYTTADGLIDGESLSLLQDRAGRLWIGTWTGVSCYDGQTFTSYTTADGLAGRQVSQLFEDRAGRLWLGHGWDPDARGVTCLDAAGCTILGVADGLASNRVHAMLEDRVGDLWFGTGNGLSRLRKGRFATFTTAAGLPNNQVLALLADRAGILWLGTDKGVGRYNGTSFAPLRGAPDAVAREPARSLAQDGDGNLWLGSFAYGALRYDGRRWVAYTTENGLPNIGVLAMFADREGHLWVGTAAGGLSRYDGGQFTTLTTRDGLPDSYVRAVTRDEQGVLWLGTRQGLARLDGKALTSLAATDTLATLDVRSLAPDHRGGLWYTGAYWEAFPRVGRVVRHDGRTFAALKGKDGLPVGEATQVLVDRRGDLWLTATPGVTRCSGQGCTTYTRRDGLASDTLYQMAEDAAGHLWFGTAAGVSRYDGRGFTTFRRQDGLRLDAVDLVAADPRGGVWFSSWGADRVIRYDGAKFTAVTAQDGLPRGVTSLTADRRGHLWVCSYGAGVARYDGHVFQSLTHSDGLASNGVQSVYEDTLDGGFWIATDDGATRYRPSALRPGIRLEQVVADRVYGPVAELALPSSQSWVEFRFQGRSLYTPPDRMAYLCRLQGREDQWRTTHEPRQRYDDLPVGTYLFEVQAVDRDLNYSDVASVRLRVHPPYMQWALAGSLGLSLAGLAVASAYGVRRRRERNQAQRERDQARDRLMDELEAELQTAHDLQMGLMPSAPPRTAGLTASGRCLPANHVGGDFYQYFPLPSGRLAVCMADVTGHAMEAAIPAVMFDGILDSQIRLGSALEDLFNRLNGILWEKLTGRTHVAFSMVLLDPVRRTVQFANAGCPYPCHYRRATQEVVELSLDAYPLGVRPDTAHRTIETCLAPGDYLVLYSDGIAEAVNTASELFGFERTVATVREACVQGLSPEGVIDYLAAAVRGFCGETAQGDDITCVVVRMEG